MEEEEWEEVVEMIQTMAEITVGKKTINVGSCYQASVPGEMSSYGDTLPYGKIL